MCVETIFYQIFNNMCQNVYLSEFCQYSLLMKDGAFII